MSQPARRLALAPADFSGFHAGQGQLSLSRGKLKLKEEFQKPQKLEKTREGAEPWARAHGAGR